MTSFLDRRGFLISWTIRFAYFICYKLFLIAPDIFNTHCARSTTGNPSKPTRTYTNTFLFVIINLRRNGWAACALTNFTEEDSNETTMVTGLGNRQNGWALGSCWTAFDQARMMTSWTIVRFNFRTPFETRPLRSSSSVWKGGTIWAY